MMSHTWPILVTGGLMSPRGYPPLYALEIFSHRVLRYFTPFLHLLAFGANLRLGGFYRIPLLAQVGLVVAAAAGARIPRYYVLVTASPALGLWDWLTKGTPAGWEQAEGTR
jgi:hypothetical protein